MATLYIVPNNFSFIHKALKDKSGIKPHWTYFGYQKLRYARASEAAAGQGAEISLGKYLKRALAELRQPYLDYIGELTRKHSGIPHWWARSLPEKNPYSSRFFLHSAYVKSALRIYSETAVSDRGAVIVFIAESAAVRAAIEENLRKSGVEPRRLEAAGSRFFMVLRDAVEILIQRIYFVLFYAARSFWARYIVQPHRWMEGEAENSLTLVHAWGDARAFRNDFNDFVDSDFEGVKKRLEDAGRRTATLVQMLPSVPFFKAVWRIGRRKQALCVLESFIYFKDIFRLAWVTMRPIDLKPYALLSGMDVSHLLDSEIKRDQVKRGVASVLLYDCFIENLKNAGAKIDRVIYTFENLNWEKVFCSSIQRHFPGAAVVAYQPARMPQSLTPYFMSKLEQPMPPLPDVIVSNGPYTYGLMKEVFGARVKLGGSLRQQYLLGLMGRRPEPSLFPQRPGGRVLVASSIGFDETVELIGKAWAAFKQDTSVSVVYKCHPSMPFAAAEKAMRLGPIPSHFSVTEEPMGSLLKKVHVLVYNTSTVSAEAMALGIPCVHVEPDGDLDMDPLDFCPESRRSVSQPEDLKKAVLEILGNYPEIIQKNYPRWQREISQFFGPVTDQTFELFSAGKS